MDTIPIWTSPWKLNGSTRVEGMESGPPESPLQTDEATPCGLLPNSSSKPPKNAPQNVSFGWFLVSMKLV